MSFHWRRGNLQLGTAGRKRRRRKGNSEDLRSLVQQITKALLGKVNERSDTAYIPYSAESGFNTYNIANPADIQPIQADSWVLPEPGPKPDRQEKPHPHQAILDPTGKFLLVPDLGFDRVHIFLVDQATLRHTEQAPLLAPPGSGPRHGVFVRAGPKTLFYVIAELSNQIFGYNVTYKDEETLGFEQIWTSTTHGLDYTVPAGASGGEIAVSVSYKRDLYHYLLPHTTGSFYLGYPSPSTTYIPRWVPR